MAWHELDDWDSIPVKDTKILIFYFVSSNCGLYGLFPRSKEALTTLVTTLHVVQELLFCGILSPICEHPNRLVIKLSGDFILLKDISSIFR